MRTALALLLGLSASPAAAAVYQAPYAAPAVQVTARAPTLNDGVSRGYANGSFWAWKGRVWTLVDGAVGRAMWTDVSTPLLPLDVIGSHIATATVLAAGTGYAVGNTITLAGGAVLTVATLSGTGVATVTIATPKWTGATPTGAAPQATTSGRGTGVSFKLSFQYPSGFSTRRVSSIYTGALVNLRRTDTGAAVDVGYTSANSLNEALVSQMASGLYIGLTRPAALRAAIWYDQGGAGRNATLGTIGGCASVGPSITPFRRLGNALSLLFDSHGQSEPWDPDCTSMSLPPGVTGATNNQTMVVVGGALTTQFKPGAWAQIGANYSGVTITAGWGSYAGDGNVRFWSNADVAPDTLDAAKDDANVMIASTVSGAEKVFFDNNSVTGTSSSVSKLTGGSLGQGSSSSSGLVDEALFIEVPWGLSATEMRQLASSIYTQFGIQPQGRNLIAILGDSHADGWGTTFQQSWPRQMLVDLHRPDTHLLNVAVAGGLLATQVAHWNTYVAPALARSSGTKIVIVTGGYNDAGQSTPTSAAGIVAQYRQASTLARSAGAKMVCGLDYIRQDMTAGHQINTTIQSVNATLRADTGRICDAKIDFAMSSRSLNNLSGPWPLPPFTTDHIHAQNAGTALLGAIAARTVAPLLP